MANLLHKLTKTKPSPTLLASLTTRLAPNPTPSLTSHLTNSENSSWEPVENLISGEMAESSRSSQIIFPNFPFGYCLSPISRPLGVVEAEDARMVWADSTKKKRKRKMSKHKYKKRMRLLRRKTRA